MSSYVQHCQAMSSHVKVYANMPQGDHQGGTGCSSLRINKTPKKAPERTAVKEQLRQLCRAISSYVKVYAKMLQRQHQEGAQDAPRREPIKRQRKHQKEQQPKNTRASYVQRSLSMSSYVQLRQSICKLGSARALMESTRCFGVSTRKKT